MRKNIEKAIHEKKKIALEIIFIIVEYPEEM